MTNPQQLKWTIKIQTSLLRELSQMYRETIGAEWQASVSLIKKENYSKGIRALLIFTDAYIAVEKLSTLSCSFNFCKLQKHEHFIYTAQFGFFCCFSLFPLFWCNFHALRKYITKKELIEFKPSYSKCHDCFMNATTQCMERVAESRYDEHHKLIWIIVKEFLWVPLKLFWFRVIEIRMTLLWCFYEHWWSFSTFQYNKPKANIAPWWPHFGRFPYVPIGP